MRFAFVAALSCILAGTAVFLACSSDTPANPPGTSTSSSSTSSSGSSGQGSSTTSSGGEQSDDDEPQDAGPKRGNNGCLIHCTDYQKGTTAVSETRADAPNGGVTWEVPEGAISVDGNFAKVTLNDGQESAYLKVDDYNFTLRDDQDPYGITVELTRQSVDSGIIDSTIEVILDTKETPRTKYLSPKNPWPRLIVGVHHYGQEIDTWGTTLGPKNVNAKTFGTRIAAKRMPGVTGPVTALVDALKIRVCYCNLDGK